MSESGFFVTEGDRQPVSFLSLLFVSLRDWDLVFSLFAGMFELVKLPCIAVCDLLF